MKAQPNVHGFGLKRIGQRFRLFNIRVGLTKDMDTLQARFFKESLKEGPCKGRTVDLEQLRAEYYLVRGWDTDRVPTEAKLQELGI